MTELLDKHALKLTEYAAETMVYFERHKLIEITKKIILELVLTRPDDVQLWIAKNVKRIAIEIYEDCLAGGKPNGVISLLRLSGNFVHRIVIFGRRGSGRKTQAINLFKCFNLVYIDAENLIYTYLRGDDENPHEPLARELQRSFYYNNCAAKAKAIADIIARRILQYDALHCGWVLVNFPNSLNDFREILENWKVPPNKVIYIQCSEKTAIKRLLNQPNMNKPHHKCTYYEEEMYYFNDQQNDIDKYLCKRHETLYVDGELCSEKVRTQLMGLVQKTPYLMGFKQDIM